MGGWGRRFRIAIQGEDPRTGRGFIWHMFHARPGGGASIGGDGWSSIGEWHSVGGLKFGSVEIAEVRFPLHFGQHEFRPGSGGKGEHRGGLGVNLDLVVETAKPARGNTAGDGARHGACGMLGGEDGLPHDYRLISAGKAERILKTKEVGITISPGDTLQVRSGGGGGWGDPARRSAEAQRRDIEQGLVGARQVTSFTIGIDVGGTFTDLVAIDERGTHRVREIALHAAGPVDRRAGRSRRTGAPASAFAKRHAQAEQTHRAWRHRRHQRAARTQGREGRAAHHRRPPRRAGDARGAEGQPLRPALAAAGAAGAATPAARCARTPACRRLGADAARRGLARRRHRHHQAVRRRLRGDLLPARLSQSRARDRDRAAAAPGLAGRVRVALQRRAAADQGIRAGLDHRRERLCRAGRASLPDQPRGPAWRGRLRRQPVRDPLARRHGAGCGGRAACGGDRPVGAGGRRCRRAPLGRAAGRGRSHSIRHGRHLHRHLADRRRRKPSSRPSAVSPASGSRCAASTSPASARAAARSRASTQPAFTSARRARAPSPALPATAMAAPRRR